MAQWLAHSETARSFLWTWFLPHLATVSRRPGYPPRAMLAASPRKGGHHGQVQYPQSAVARQVRPEHGQLRRRSRVHADREARARLGTAHDASRGRILPHREADD